MAQKNSWQKGMVKIIYHVVAAPTAGCLQGTPFA